jgi:N-acetylmuramoyl-L-alanine amidase
VSARAPRLVAALLGLILTGLPGSTPAQERAALRLVAPGGAEATVAVATDHGFAAVPFRTLERLGWGVAVLSDGGEARRAPHVIRVRAGSPLFRWDDDLLQLTHAPYRAGDDLWIPLQLLSDFLPQRAEDDYAFESEPLVLRVMRASAWVELAEAPEVPARVAVEPPPTPAPTPAPRPSPSPALAPPPATAAPVPVRGARPVVIIDPGHGGLDPGARGPAGVREKDVALAIALGLARELERVGDVDVHLTRATDRQVPLWERGEWASGIKGDRPGIFVSIHANSDASLAARGFETYFLSEARTEHERRVAALENAAFRAAAETSDSLAADPALDFILKDLNNLDHQHWSALLAELVQARIEPIHSGPNRGVKQAPLAVITNALMPSVLLEIGFISNRTEERLLASRDFQASAARALADAIRDFFERYPPGADAPEAVR